MVKYRLYPTLLDHYSLYLNGSVDEDYMINRINRVRDFDENTLKKMQKGVRFEDAVLKDQTEEFDPEIIRRVRALLPEVYKTQVFLQFTLEEIRFYGYADVVGDFRIIDLKSTSRFREEKYLNGFQNLYLFSLKNEGFKTMEYIVYDFNEIHHLVYPLADFNFEPFLEKMKSFTRFLEEHRPQITDTRIFVKPQANSLF